MQVTHVDANVTHAVIGGDAAQDFGISNSAEFFNILSNTLYSDKPLAVVREVLCNAWDIHIATGKTDTPVEVTLTDEGVFTIRDFGTGIAHEDMGPVYCTYGNSTKKNDGSQTGGFGLGCKAPFAVVDHFDVESNHEGTKSIYAISKSSAEVAGKPSLTRIVEVPTTETGMKVSMKLPQAMRNRFRDLVRMIARMGEMNVTLNGTQLEVLPFSEAQQGFVITNQMEGVSGADTNKLFVRYGNVVYPIPSHDTFGVEFSKCLDLLGLLNNGTHARYNGTHMRLIIQAKPNTVAVTPSRESLSMTDQTVNALQELLSDFLAKTGSRLSTECVRIATEVVERQWIAGRPADLLLDSNNLPKVQQVMNFDPHQQIVEHGKPILRMEDVSSYYMSRSYPDFAGFQERDFSTRIRAFINSGFGNRGKIQSFWKEMKTNGLNKRSDWMLRNIMSPLMLDISNDPTMDASKLFAYLKNSEPPKRDAKGKIIVKMGDSPRRFSRGYSSWSDMRFVQMIDIDPRPLKEYLPFLRNFVVLSYNRADVEDRLPNNREMRNWFGSHHNTLIYVVSRKKGAAEEARKFFEDRKIYVVDLTKIVDEERALDALAQRNAPVTLAPPKPKKKGLISLTNYLGEKGTFHSVKSLPGHILEGDDRIELPEAVTLIGEAYGSGRVPIVDMDKETNLLVTKLYGDVTGVAVNVNQYDKFVSMGSKPFAQFVLDKVMLEIQTSPTIEAAFTHSWEAVESDVTSLTRVMSWGDQQMIRKMLRTPKLISALGINNPATDHDRMMVAIANQLAGVTSLRNRATDMAFFTEMKKNAKPSKEVIGLIDKYKNSKLIKYVDMDEIVSLFQQTPSNRVDPDGIKNHQALCQGAVDLLAYAIG